MNTLTSEARNRVTKQVRAIWFAKNVLAPLSFVLFAWLLSSSVSLSNILRAGVESATSLPSFWAFAKSAFANAGVLVLGITALSVVSGVVLVKKIVAGGASGVSMIIRRVT